MAGWTDCMKLATMGGDPWMTSCLSQVLVSMADNIKGTQTPSPQPVHGVLFRLTVWKLETAPDSHPSGPRQLTSLVHSPIFSTANGVPPPLSTNWDNSHKVSLYEALIIVIINVTDYARQAMQDWISS